MLEVRNLSIQYPDHPLIKNINFRLEEGDICFLVGDSGSGKTTACLAMAGVLSHVKPEAIVSGQIIFKDINLKKENPPPDLAITLENPYSQLTAIKSNVKEEIACGLEMRGIEPEEMLRRINVIAGKFGIAHLMSRDPRSLSGGEIQRIVISSSFVLKPKLWILDRPLSELDPYARHLFLKELVQYAKENKAIIILSDEPAPDIYSIASHVLTLKSGISNFSVNNKKGRIENINVSELDTSIAFTKNKNKTNKKESKFNPSLQSKILCFSYSKQQSNIINNISLNVQRGECLWITGPNGCGKTTLAKLIIGLLKPIEGSVLINGINPAKEPLWKVARIASYAFQNPDLQIFSTKIWDEVLSGPKFLGYSDEKCINLTEWALKLFGLREKAKHHPQDLNRSEKKRLGLASTFAMDTPILILDEPSQFQSIKEKQIIREAMRNALNMGKSILCITHDLDLIF